MKPLIVPALFAMLVLAPAVSGQDGDALVEEGRQAFMRVGCYGCHTVGRMGTPLARDLTHVGGKYPPEYLRRWLRDPKHVRPTTNMPVLDLTDAEIRALAAYLAAQQ